MLVCCLVVWATQFAASLLLDPCIGSSGSANYTCMSPALNWEKSCSTTHKSKNFKALAESWDIQKWPDDLPLAMRVILISVQCLLDPPGIKSSQVQTEAKEQSLY